jgi:hypothetical protein
MNADGTGQTRLTENDGDDGAPAWSPDGAAIVFHSSRNAPEDDSYELYSVRPDGSCLTWLTNGVDDSFAPDWQPGSGGVPDSLGCGAVPREPAGEKSPRGAGLWLGRQPGGRLLTKAGRRQLDYRDCASFEPSDCGRSVGLENSDACERTPLKALLEAAGTVELRRGALVYRFTDEETAYAYVYSGDYTVSVFSELYDELNGALDALRPLPSPDAVDALEPPHFPRGLIRQIGTAQRLGDARAVSRKLHVSRRRARALVQLGEAVKPLGKLQPADC